MNQITPDQPLTIHLSVWRQPSPEAAGGFQHYQLDDLSPDLSLLEALDVLNGRLIQAGERPVRFDHDCREGICGSCGFLVNGQAQGPRSGTTVCQLYLRQFSSGDTLVLEPFRAGAFPPVADLAVDRSSLDRILMAGGYCSINAGSAPEANSILIGRDQATRAFEAATCIGCGACVAACPNASASLFTAAKVAHLAQLPQGQPERRQRAQAMVERMRQEGFGSCSSHLECEASCPQGIGADWISWLQRELLWPKSH